MQVGREVEKIRGLDPLRPPEAVATATTALLTLSAPLNATRVTLTTITPNVSLAAMGNDDLLAGILFPSPFRKMQKMSHQEQIQNQNTNSQPGQQDDKKGAQQEDVERRCNNQLLR